MKNVTAHISYFRCSSVTKIYPLKDREIEVMFQKKEMQGIRSKRNRQAVITAALLNIQAELLCLK